MHPMTDYYLAVAPQLPLTSNRWLECGSSYIFGKLGNDLDILVHPACSLEEAFIKFRDADWDVAVGDYAPCAGHWFSAKKTLQGPDGPVLVNALVSTDLEWVANMRSGAQVCRLLHLAKIPVPKELRVAVHQLLAEFQEPEDAAKFLKPAAEYAPGTEVSRHHAQLMAPEPDIGESYRAAFYADAAKDFEG